MMSWEDNVRKMDPYIPGEQPDFPDMVKLNTNENPYPPAPGVRKLLAELDADRLKLYPKPDAKELVEALAKAYGVDVKNVFMGVGSDDVLGTAFLTFFTGDKPVLFPDISYSFYPVWAKLYRIPFETPALDENFCIVKEDYMRENGGIVISNPNAPTSIAVSMDFIEDIAKANPDSVVIVDEAYVDYGGESCIPLTKKYDNVLVVQTFSKSRSMAGMRIGFAIGNEKLISYMFDVRNSYNSYTMNYPSIMCGAEALKDKAYFEETTRKIIATREKYKKILCEIGFDCPDSCSNFLFAEHKTMAAKVIFEKLREKHVFVRYFKTPRIDNRLRITIGTEDEMEKLVSALKEILA
ncbi:MAG: histidinol-phosphate transaminase [Lachnospiraceae bacterium]|nr:histidinol-phosphate transaminase [Lachnospiraceae bacterium]